MMLGLNLQALGSNTIAIRETVWCPKPRLLEEQPERGLTLPGAFSRAAQASLDR